MHLSAYHHTYKQLDSILSDPSNKIHSPFFDLVKKVNETNPRLTYSFKLATSPSMGYKSEAQYFIYKKASKREDQSRQSSIFSMTLQEKYAKSLLDDNELYFDYDFDTHLLKLDRDGKLIQALLGAITEIQPKYNLKTYYISRSITFQVK